MYIEKAAQNYTEKKGTKQPNFLNNFQYGTDH